MRSFRERYGPAALVAGASEGIGAAFARRLAARGLDLVLVARRQDRLETLAGELRASVEVRTLALDLASPDLAGRVREGTRGLEVGLVVFNAACLPIGPFLDRELGDHARALDVNCRAPLALCRLLGGSMARRGRGGIVLMGSMAGLQGSALVASYAASKAFDLVLAESLWDELRERGVDVLVCVAGATRTPGYVASEPASTGLVSAPVMEPADVAAAALGALGRRPSVVAGRTNRLASVLMGSLLPRRVATSIMGRTTRSLYGRSRS